MLWAMILLQISADLYLISIDIYVTIANAIVKGFFNYCYISIEKVYCLKLAVLELMQ